MNRSVWDRQIAFADKYNDPGQFTALIGFEWTSIATQETPGNLHRVVIFRDGVAKAGQLSFMQILADELESKNIPVNAVDPGPVRTRFRTMAYPAENMRKLTKPEEITDAFVYLLSDAVTETGKTLSLKDSEK